MDKAYGEVIIQSGESSNNENIEKFSKGFVQYSTIQPSLNNNKVVGKISKNSNSQYESFEVNVTCISFANKFEDQTLIETKDPVVKKYSTTRLSEKNIKKDIKDFVCLYSGKTQASLLRKRLIALESIYGDLSKQNHNFKVN